jgi:ribosomal protein L29
MIPLTYIFCHQIRSNIARLKTMQMMMSLCKGATDDQGDTPMCPYGNEIESTSEFDDDDYYNEKGFRCSGGSVTTGLRTIKYEKDKNQRNLYKKAANKKLLREKDPENLKSSELKTESMNAREMSASQHSFEQYGKINMVKIFYR